MPSVDPQPQTTQYLSFLLDGEAYAVAILAVREILPYQAPTFVPQTHRPIRGVINLRGRVIPIVDLALKLGLPPTRTTRWTCIIVTEINLAGEDATIGMLADAVSEVIALGPGDVEAPPSFGTRVRPDLLSGVGKVNQRFVPLLDLGRVLPLERDVSITVHGGAPPVAKS
jgi:purine-binding chemotaxis protein CheW